jgi:hypothetical protein
VAKEMKVQTLLWTCCVCDIHDDITILLFLGFKIHHQANDLNSIHHMINIVYNIQKTLRFKYPKLGRRAIVGDKLMATKKRKYFQQQCC